MRTIERETRCSQTEAEHIAVKIKDSLPEGDKIKQKERIGSKFMLLLVLAAVAVGGYFAYGYNISDPQNYAIEEKDPSIETELIAEVGQCYWDFEEYDPEETQRNAVQLFDIMENDEGQFFIYRDYPGEKVDYESGEYAENLFRTNKAYFDVATEEFEYLPRLTTDFVSAKFGRLVKKYLNSDCTKVNYNGVRVEEDDPNGSVCASEIEEYIDNHLFDGKSAQDYFTSKNLDITCNNVKVQKIGIQPPGYVYFAICEAEVTTNTCDGESLFPKAGETGTVTVEVIAVCEQANLSMYRLCVLDIIIR